MLTDLSKPSVFQARMAVALVIVLIGASGKEVYTQRSEIPNRTVAYTSDVREQIKKVIPAIGLVLVRAASDPDQKLRPRGSAVIVRKDGLVMTNSHVIARDRSTKLFDDIFLSLPSE